MEKGQIPEKNLSAKELTEAIEAATDFVAENGLGNGFGRENAGVNVGAGSSRGLSPDAMRDLGRMAQTAGAISGANVSGAGVGGIGANRADMDRADMDRIDVNGIGMNGVNAEERAIASTNEVKQLVAAENGYAEAGRLTPGENVVGGESEVEVEERLKSDQETAKIQSGVGLSKDQLWMHEIAEKSGKKLAELVQRRVGEITAQAEFNPRALEEERFRLMLGSIRNDEGYSFGGRN